MQASADLDMRRGAINPLFLVVLVLLLAAGTFVVIVILSDHRPSGGGEAGADIKALTEEIKKLNYCELDSDCIAAASPGCPLECFWLVNKGSDFKKAQERAAEYIKSESRCMYSCLPPPAKLTCDQGICMAPDASGAMEEKTAEGPTGAKGQVVFEPLCSDAQKKGGSCEVQPYQTTVTIYRKPELGRVYARIQTDLGGYFLISLFPGSYIFSIKDMDAGKQCGDADVDIKRGSYTDIKIVCDTVAR